MNCQFKLAVNGCHFVCFGWLVDNQLGDAYTKSWKFPEITRTHCFYSIFSKTNKKPPFSIVF